MIVTGYYVFVDISDCIAKTLTLVKEVKVPYRVLKQVQHSAMNQQTKLVARITADRVAMALRPTGVPPIPLDTASAMNIQKKILEKSTWLLQDILDQ